MRAKPNHPITKIESDAFHRDGAVLIKSALTTEWVDILRDGLDDAIDHPDHMSGLAGRELRVDQFPAARSPGLRRIVEESPIAEIVGSALRGAVRFYMDQLFYKPAGVIAATPWHQDTSYYNVAGHDVIRAWVSPDPVPREASLEIVCGSHLWNVTYSPLAGRDPERDPDAKAMLDAAVPGEPMIGVDAYEEWTYFSGILDKNLPLLPDIESHRDSYRILGWDYEPGDVILFHGDVLHSALGEIDRPLPRRTHASLWAGPDVRYLHRIGQVIPDPKALYTHKPVSGQPLSDFPDVFPVAWAP